MMSKQYENELNETIRSSPTLARSEIWSSHKETLFDTIEECLLRAGLLDALGRNMELQVLRGDFSSMQLPPYQEPARRPLLPGAGGGKEEPAYPLQVGPRAAPGRPANVPAAVGGRLVHGRDPHDGTGRLGAEPSRTQHRFLKGTRLRRVLKAKGNPPVIFLR